MKLTNNNAIAITNILSGMKLNKITDKAVKNALVWDYIALRKVARDANADTQEVITKFQDDWKEAIIPVRTLREADKPIVGYDEYLDAEKDANATIAAILEKETDVDIRPVGLERFLNAIDDDELSFEQVAVLKDFGLIN